MINIFKNKTNTNKKYIAFSFDDGPNCKNTIEILKVLKKHHAKATFFLIGNRIEGHVLNSNTYKKYGCEIGLHTFEHESLISKNDDHIRTTLLDCKNTINIYFKTDSTLMRPPYGHINDKVCDILKELGLPAILWSVDSQDWKLEDKKEIVDCILKEADDGDIVIMHDKNVKTVEALDMVLTILEKQNYSFVTISELFKIKNISIKPGEIYTSAK